MAAPTPLACRAVVEPPEWLRDAGLAFIAFIGGHGISAIRDSQRESRRINTELRDSNIRLAIGVESISNNLEKIETEIHKQVGDLRGELYRYHNIHTERSNSIETRLDALGQRIDILVFDKEVPPKPPVGRTAWERGCRPLPDIDDPTDLSSHPG